MIVLLVDSKAHHTWSEQHEVIFISTYTEAVLLHRVHCELSPIDVDAEYRRHVYPVYAIRALRIWYAPKQGAVIPIS